MRQGFKDHQAAQTMAIGMTADFQDSTHDEIYNERFLSGQILAGEGRRIAKQLGK